MYPTMQAADITHDSLIMMLASGNGKNVMRVAMQVV
jgi:hypothetical protein